jgi:hypothetical protein
MTKLIHSLPWTLAVSLAAQAAESEAIRIPLSNGTAIESFQAGTREPSLDEISDRVLHERLKKSLEM